MRESAPIRWALCACVVLIGCGQLAAYALFRAKSIDFIAAHHNATAAEYSRAHLIGTPAQLLFGSAGQDAKRLGDGWNLPDAEGTWSMSNDAWLVLFLKRSALSRTVALRMHLQVYPGIRGNRLSINVNGTQLATATSSDGDHPVDLAIPANLLESGQVLVNLHVDHCESPLRERTGTDPRRLGVLLKSIDVLADAQHAERIAEQAK